MTTINWEIIAQGEEIRHVIENDKVFVKGKTESSNQSKFSQIVNQLRLLTVIMRICTFYFILNTHKGHAALKPMHFPITICKLTSPNIDF